jgi:hypothetical protein
VAEQADDPREPRERLHADHRRQQHETGSLRISRSLEHIERVLQDQRAAVRIADEHHGLVVADGRAQVTNAESDRCGPVLPRDVGQGRRHRAMAGDPQRDHFVAAPAKVFANRTHAVWRIGQPVDEQRAANWFGGG